MKSNQSKLFIELLNNINKIHVHAFDQIYIIGIELVNRTFTVITQYDRQIQRTTVKLPFECKALRSKIKPTTQLMIPLELQRPDSKLTSNELDIHTQLGLVWNAKYFQQVRFIGCYMSQLPIIKKSEWTEPTLSEELDGDDLVDSLNRIDINSVQSECLFERARDLPSEGWTELVECWVCHNEEYSTIRASNFSNQGIFFPSPDVLHVGTRRILFHPDHLMAPHDIQCKKMVEDHMSTYSSTHPEHLNELIYLDLECPHCSDPLGKVIIDPVLKEDQKEHSIVISVPKHHIYTQHPFDQRPTIPYSIMLLQDMYDLNQHHSISRFLLHSPDPNAPKVKITIMNWQMYIISTDLNQNNQFQPSTKFIFELIQNENNDDTTELTNESEAFEPIQYPTKIVEELIVTIKDNQQYLIPSKRQFRMNSISILFWD